MVGVQQADFAFVGVVRLGVRGVGSASLVLDDL
jgi:hypothetical protein